MGRRQAPTARMRTLVVSTALPSDPVRLFRRCTALHDAELAASPGSPATGEIHDEVQTKGISVGTWSCLIAMAGLKKKSTSSYELMLPSGGSDRRRSGDLSIFSRTLYQLSYRA